MSAEQSSAPKEAQPNQKLSNEELTELISMADNLVMDQPLEIDGEEGDPDRMEWRTLDFDGADGNLYYLTRNYVDPEGPGLTLGIRTSDDDPEERLPGLYLSFKSDGQQSLASENGQETTEVTIPGGLANKDNAFSFAKDYLTNMTAQYEIFKKQGELEKRLGAVAEEQQFSEWFELDQKTVDEVLANTSFMGEEVKGRQLTAETVQEMGLEPVRGQQVTEALTVYFSRVYLLEGRPAVHAVTKHKDDYVARTYYLSTSQNVWRYLPAYGKNGNDQWLNKGQSEQTLNLPIELQMSLNRLAERPFRVPFKDAELAFYGTTGNKPRDYETRYTEVVNPTNNDDADQGMHLDSVRDDQFAKTKQPEDLVYTEEFKDKYPDFSQTLAEWQNSSRLYGEVKAKVIPSLDGTWHYLFFTDAKGRTWIGQVDIVDAPIAPTLLRKKAFNVGLVTTPAYETRGQAAQYAGEALGRDYVDVYEKYLSRLPIIKDFNTKAK